MSRADNSPDSELFTPPHALQIVSDELPSPVAYWRQIAEEYPHLEQHAENISAFLMQVDTQLRRSDVVEVSSKTVDMWYRFHGSFNFLPMDRVDLFVLAADKLETTTWSAWLLKGNLYHEVALMQADPDQAVIFLEKAKGCYERLKGVDKSHQLVRQGLMHWHDADIEVARQRGHQDPERFGEAHFARSQARYLGAIATRLARDEHRVKNRGHLINLASDAWEMFGIVAYNDSLITTDSWKSRIARSAFSREDEPLYGFAKDDTRRVKAKDIQVERLGFDIVISDGETGLHIPIQMKSGLSGGKAYNMRIEKIMGRYTSRHAELLADVQTALEVMRARYADTPIDENKQERLVHLQGLTRAKQLLAA